MILLVYISNKITIYEAKLIELKRKTDKFKIIAGCYKKKPPFQQQIELVQGIIKYVENLYNTFNKQDLIDIYRLFHLTTAEYSTFSSTQVIFSRYTISWAKKQPSTNFKEVKSYRLFSHYIRIKLDNRRTTGKYLNVQKLNNTF